MSPRFARAYSARPQTRRGERGWIWAAVATSQKNQNDTAALRLTLSKRNWLFCSRASASHNKTSAISSGNILGSASA
jgi:hypothetical protein